MTLDPKTLNEIEVAIRNGEELAAEGPISAADLNVHLFYMGRLLLDHGEALLAAIPRWRPIETAPRDGDPVLVWMLASGHCAIASWRPEGWHVSGWKISPTHWMPLPAAPKEESNG